VTRGLAVLVLLVTAACRREPAAGSGESGSGAAVGGIAGAGAVGGIDGAGAVGARGSAGDGGGAGTDVGNGGTGSDVGNGRAGSAAGSGDSGRDAGVAGGDAGVGAVPAIVDAGPAIVDAAVAVTPPPKQPAKPCFIGGCGSELCSDRQGMASPCVVRPEHACYRGATCERQAGGACGWTQTPALQQCLAGVRAQPPTTLTP